MAERTPLSDDLDAQLIRLCEQHVANVEAFDTQGGSFANFHAWQSTTQAVTEARPKTLAGFIAKARAIHAEVTGLDGTETPNDGSRAAAWAWDLVLDLALPHDAVRRPTRVGIPPISCDDVSGRPECPSIFDLWRLSAAATEDLNASTKEGNEQAEALAVDRFDALRELALLLPARDLRDVAAQLAFAAQLADDAAGSDSSATERNFRALTRAMASAFPIVRQAAGIAPSELSRGDRYILNLHRREFVGMPTPPKNKTAKSVAVQ